MCPTCNADLPRLTAPCCPVCALPTPAGATCGNCLHQPPSFDATLACFAYGFPVDRLVQALKYRHTLAIARFFSRCLLQTANAADLTKTADLLMALPLSSQRLAARGFNQSMELARPVARQLAKPLQITGYMRSLHTPPQASLPWKERQKNIRGAFECHLDLTGKHILVIDDVMTTGATLNEFARTLKKHGAHQVSNLVLARALRDLTNV
ncbi:MAG: ComF family protein [Sterolibacterium sp.]|nr:ComF family protein [Sterolibacterium sp.]